MRQDRWWFVAGMNGGLALAMFWLAGTLRGNMLVGFAAGVVAAFVIWQLASTVFDRFLRQLEPTVEPRQEKRDERYRD